MAALSSLWCRFIADAQYLSTLQNVFFSVCDLRYIILEIIAQNLGCCLHFISDSLKVPAVVVALEESCVMSRGL